jgi:hypothetical protein
VSGKNARGQVLAVGVDRVDVEGHRGVDVAARVELGAVDEVDVGHHLPAALGRALHGLHDLGLVGAEGVRDAVRELLALGGRPLHVLAADRVHREGARLGPGPDLVEALLAPDRGVAIDDVQAARLAELLGLPLLERQAGLVGPDVRVLDAGRQERESEAGRQQGSAHVHL